MSNDPPLVPARGIGDVVPGRIVLQLGNSAPSEIAIEAAMRIASAFGGGLQGLLVQDGQLRALAALPIAREISSLGRRSRPFCLADLEKDLDIASAALRRRIEHLARAAQVSVDFKVVSEGTGRLGEVFSAHCEAESLVAFGDPLGVGHLRLLHQLLSEMSAVRGVLFVGPGVRRFGAPVVVVLEADTDPQRLVAAACRILAAGSGDLTVLLHDGGDEQLRQVKETVARHLAAGTAVTFVRLARLPWQPTIAAEAIRRLRGGLVIARYGGDFAPTEGSLAPLMQAMECPLLLLK